MLRLLCAERLLCEAAGASCGDDAPAAPRPRPGAVSFLHRFGSAINRHVHLHACVTDGVFTPNGDGPPAFLPARPITQADLASLTEKVRRRVVRWFRMQRLPFALERLSVRRGDDGRLARVRYVLPRHKAANWVGPRRGRSSTRPGENGVVELLPFEFLNRLADLIPQQRCLLVLQSSSGLDHFRLQFTERFAE